jgi:predicted metalloendopeptidase
VLINKVGKLRQSSWGLKDYAHYKKRESDPLIVAYKSYMTTVAGLFNVTSNKTLEFVHNTFSLEKRLAQVNKKQSTCLSNLIGSVVSYKTFIELSVLPAIIYYTRELTGMAHCILTKWHERLNEDRENVHAKT